jgi:hypothetical protein
MVSIEPFSFLLPKLENRRADQHRKNQHSEHDDADEKKPRVKAH